ncbi:MAG: hypothetical protein M1830_002842 [Pleopsidium flavum]|nr:MAG: hypothetical protein M1830_002842 [Pleopsidium flavum]
MDPKMDSGYLAPGEMLEDDYDVLKELLPEEVIGIMDQMLCHEMAWHMGHPLSQTLFTSLHLDRLLWPDPKTLEEARFDRDDQDQRGGPLLHVVLRAYCLTLITTCDFVHRRIGNEHCYEEEDFVTQLYNRQLLSDFDEEEILNMLSRALSWLDDQRDSIPEETITALKTRLRFRELFFEAVAVDLDIITDKSTERWEQCAAMLPSLTASRTIGKPVEEAFSVKVQRKLASTVPPRPIVKTSFQDAIRHLTQLCQDGKDVVQILQYHGSNSLLVRLPASMSMTFVLTFQSRKPQPSVYIRALLQSILFGEMKILGTMSIKQLLFDDLSEIVLPADLLLDSQNSEVELPKDPRFQIAKRMDIFVARAGQSYIEVLRALNMNRSRIRRTLCHTVTDWDNLQLDAEELDIELRPYTNEKPVLDSRLSDEPMFSFPLSSWAYYHKLHQMDSVVQLGFELEVYQPDELAGMYWYLQHLTQTRLRHIERIRGFTTRRLTHLSKPTAQQKDSFSKSLSFLNFSMLEASSTQSFADGLTCLFTTLHRLSLLPVPTRPYSTDAMRYELRMKPFLHISLPEHLPYPQFSQLVTVPTESPQELLEAADIAIKQARKDWDVLSKMSAETARCRGCEGEWRKNIKDVLRACIAASIAISTVRKALSEMGVKKGERLDLSGRLKVDIPVTGKGYHDWWIVPKISVLP